MNVVQKADLDALIGVAALSARYRRKRGASDKEKNFCQVQVFSCIGSWLKGWASTFRTGVMLAVCSNMDTETLLETAPKKKAKMSCRKAFTKLKRFI